MAISTLPRVFYRGVGSVKPSLCVRGPTTLLPTSQPIVAPLDEGRIPKWGILALTCYCNYFSSCIGYFYVSTDDYVLPKAS